MTSTKIGISHSTNPFSSAYSVRATAICILVAYFALISILRQFHTGGGWAATDSRIFHIPVINYFIGNGFGKGFAFDYPDDSIAMFPGMHIFFAGLAQMLGFTRLEFNGLPAFFFQSILGGALLYGSYRLTLVICSRASEASFFIVTALSSSYTMYSWIYVTTEIGSLAFYFLMLLVLFEEKVSKRDSLFFSGLSVASMLFRQSNATLSAAFIGNKALLNLKYGRPTFSGYSVVDLVPLLAAVCFLGFLFYLWGGLVPAFARIHQPHGINLVALVHVFALTGLIAWPLAFSSWRLLATNNKYLILSAASTIVVVLLSCIFLPLNLDRDSGRWGSIVWTIEGFFRPYGLGTVTVGGEIAVGFFIWLSIAYQCIRSRTLLPEVLLFGLFTVSILGQQMSWQRYFEAQLLVTLAIALLRSKPHRIELALCTVWFGGYSLVSIAKYVSS